MEEKNHRRWWLLGAALVVGGIAYVFITRGGVETMETFADGITGHQAVRTGRHLEHEIQGIVDQREEQYEALNGGE